MLNQYIDIILFAGVAIFLAWRLRSVLGRRTGTERPSAMGPMRDSAGPVVMPRPGGKVIDLVPNRAQTPLQAGLAQIQAADPGFRAEPFVEGARHAFEMIVKAFAAGDTATLRPLVSDDVYDSFTEVIRNRLAAKEAVDTKILRMQDPEILEARLEGRTAQLVVKFVSSQVSVTRDGAGKIVEGDPERQAEHVDVWTFGRNVRSSDPNWALVATTHPE
jgi:predicted lipid-binding transport protein (Tim44 family)